MNTSSKAFPVRSGLEPYTIPIVGPGPLYATGAALCAGSWDPHCVHPLLSPLPWESPHCYVGITIPPPLVGAVFYPLLWSPIAAIEVQSSHPHTHSSHPLLAVQAPCQSLRLLGQPKPPHQHGCKVSDLLGPPPAILGDSGFCRNGNNVWSSSWTGAWMPHSPWRLEVGY